MARQITKAAWSLSFNGRDDDYNDIKRVDVNFENPEDDDELIAQLNTFLRAAGAERIVCKTIDRG